MNCFKPDRMAGSLFFTVTSSVAKSIPENFARGYYLTANRMKYRPAESSIVFRVGKQSRFVLTLKNPQSQSQNCEHTSKALQLA